METNRLIRAALAETESQARTEKRAQRIVHKADAWDRDELTERYAWMLLLACELHQMTRLLRQNAALNDSQTERFMRCARPAIESAMKAERDHKRGAAAKLANDPKQAAKREAFKMWQAWQAGHARYKSGADFARHVVDVLPLESTKQVERWATTWRREAQATK